MIIIVARSREFHWWKCWIRGQHGKTGGCNHCEGGRRQNHQLRYISGFSVARHSVDVAAVRWFSRRNAHPICCLLKCAWTMDQSTTHQTTGNRSCGVCIVEEQNPKPNPFLPDDSTKCGERFATRAIGSEH